MADGNACAASWAGRADAASRLLPRGRHGADGGVQPFGGSSLGGVLLGLAQLGDGLGEGG